MPDQCRAVTDDGERCSRPAEDDGFCHQHGPEDETVSDEAEKDSATEAEQETEAAADSTESESTTADADESEDAQMDENEDTRDEAEDSREDSEADDRSGNGDASESDTDGEPDIVSVKRTVQQDVPALIDRELDGVTSVVREEDGWMATVEMVERHSVPDTQDILGHYEVSLNDSANIDGYRRLETYRRADGPPYEG